MSGRRLLIVDPDGELRHATARALARHGFDTLEAGDVDAAFRQFLAGRPAAILMCVGEADASHLELCRKLRALPGADHLILLPVLASGSDEHAVAAALAAGATDCLNRPLNYVLLRHRLEQLFGARDVALALERSNRSLATAQRVARLGDWRLDVTRDLLSFSPEVARILRLPATAGMATSFAAFLHALHPEDRPLVTTAFERARDEGIPFSFETRAVGPDHEVRIIRLWGQRAAEQSFGARELCGAMKDITDRRSHQEQIRYLANYDQTTRLPNRTQLEAAVRRLLAAHGSARARPFVLVSLGLDDYRRATEALDRPALEELMRMIGERLQTALRYREPTARSGRENLAAGAHAAPRDRNDLVARVGGTEFMVLLDGVPPSLAEPIAARLCQRLGRPFLVAGHTIHLTASAGLAAYPEDGCEVAPLVHAADAALTDSIRRGGGRCQRFSPSIGETIRSRIVREATLRAAMAEDRFLLHYQPRVCLRSNRVIGAEALLRMQSVEDDGAVRLVPPSEFIPLAEELGLIVEIGRGVVSNALRQLRAWQRLALVPDDFVMSVNISPRQFADAGLFGHIEAVLEAESVAPRCLELEITEGTLVSDLDMTSRLLAARRHLGLRVAIDDYGTGYSSLAYLRGLPVDTLKIDRCFVAGLDSTQADEAIVRFTVQLAHHLNLGVCAEGVETPAQLDVLRSLGCDQVQGYHFGRPMAAEDFAARLLPAWCEEDVVSTPRRADAATVAPRPATVEREDVIVLEESAAPGTAGPVGVSRRGDPAS